MTPTSLRRIGPYMLRADEDADVIRALDASNNKIGLLRAAIRLAMGRKLSAEEKAIVERARSRE